MNSNIQNEIMRKFVENELTSAPAATRLDWERTKTEGINLCFTHLHAHMDTNSIRNMIYPTINEFGVRCWGHHDILSHQVITKMKWNCVHWRAINEHVRLMFGSRTQPMSVPFPHFVGPWNLCRRTHTKQKRNKWLSKRNVCCPELGNCVRLN